MRNEIVELKEVTSSSYALYHDNERVGLIAYEGDELMVEVYEEYRGNHYATNALYLFSAFLHESGVSKINAHIPSDNDIMRHVAEHSGFQKGGKSEDHLIYFHLDEASVLDDQAKEGLKTVYFAGGCFWGVERIFQLLDGVKETTCGYANGSMADPRYEDLMRLDTGFKECVRVDFDESLTSLEKLFKAFFLCIDPEQSDGQGEDIGSQYKTGVYYLDEEIGERLAFLFGEEKKKHEKFFVECGPLKNFYRAEEYHQDYLDKNPDGYCHISLSAYREVKKLNEM